MIFEEGGDGVELVRGGDDGVFFFVGEDVVGTGFDGEVHEGVGGEGGGGKFDGSDALEEVGDAAGAAHGAEVFIEGDADVGGGAVFVVGDAFDEEGDATWGVAFVGDFLEGGAFEFAEAFFDGAVDIFVGHVGAAGAEEGGAEARVGVGVFAAVFDGEDDFAGEFAEDFCLTGFAWREAPPAPQSECSSLNSTC